MILANKIILAVVISSSGYFRIIDRKKDFEAKPLPWAGQSIHNHRLTDQYSCDCRVEIFYPAPYSIVKQVGGRGMWPMYVSWSGEL
jgi:hypothetical protein